MNPRKFLLTLFIFILSCEIFATAPRMQRAKVFADRRKYRVQGHDQYRFKGCEAFNEDRDSYYIFSCNEETFEGPLDNLEKQQYRISKKVFGDNFLRGLRDYTLSSLKENEDNLTKTLNCINSTDPECKEKVENLLQYFKSNLPSYRKIISLSKLHHVGGRGFSFFNIVKDIEHDDLDYEIPEMSDEEYLEARELKDEILYNIKQDSLSQIDEPCIKYDFEFKKKLCPRNIENKIKNEVQKGVERVKEQYIREYNRVTNSDPLLARVNLRGNESDEEILKEVRKQLIDSIAANKKSFEDIKELEDDDDLIDLVKNKAAVDGYLSTLGHSRALCDVSQDLYEDVETSKLMTSLYIGGAAIVGGGLCLGTFGFGCALGVAIAAESVDLYLQQSELNESRQSFASGIGSLDRVESARSDRDMALAFVAIGSSGHLLKPVARVARGSYRASRQSVDSVYEDFKATKELADLRNYRASYPDSFDNISSLKSKYSEFSLTTPRVNSRWIDNARNSNSSLYLDIENAALKRLNDTLGDKELVTSLTNLHKDVLYKNINELVKKYPQINFDIYSDFKSLRFAFSPKNIPKDIEAKFLKDLDKTYKEANFEFAKMVKNLDGLGAEKPAMWFEAGISNTADAAGQAAKRARRITRDGPQIVSFNSVRSMMDDDIIAINKFNDGLSSGVLSNTDLVQNLPSGKKILSLNAIETIRKSIGKYKQDMVDEISKKSNGLSHSAVKDSLDAKEVQDQFAKKFGVELDTSESIRLVRHVNQLDGLTPGLWQESRVIASLDRATFGGFSGDVTGMGARNIQQVAVDIAESTSQSADDILAATRRGEQRVTETFNEIKDNFTNTVKEALDKRSIPYSSKCSGDDCVVIPKVALSKKDELEIIEAFRKQDNPSQYRLSFIPPGIDESKRTMMATHGELVEKEFRKEVVGVGVGKISQQKLSNITLGTRMPSSSDGSIDLYVGLGREVRLSESELQILREAHKKAIDKVNRELSSEGRDAISYKGGATEIIE